MDTKRIISLRSAVNLDINLYEWYITLIGNEITLFSNGNYLGVNIEQLGRPRPWEKVVVQESLPLLPRVKPLIEISEEETTLYALHGKVSHVNVQCPYSVDSPLLFLKGHILEIERQNPGTMLQMFKNYQKQILPVLQNGIQLKKQSLEEEKKSRALAKGETIETNKEENDFNLTYCKRCNYPTTGDYCSWCKMLEQLQKFKETHPEKFRSICKCDQCLKMRGEKRDIEDIEKNAVEPKPKRLHVRCPRCHRPGHVLPRAGGNAPRGPASRSQEADGVGSGMIDESRGRPGAPAPAPEPEP